MPVLFFGYLHPASLEFIKTICRPGDARKMRAIFEQLWAAFSLLLLRPRVIMFIRSKPKQADSVHAFVASRAERNLMKRDASYFREAAEEGRLIHVQWKHSGKIIGAVSFAREFLDGGAVEYELTGLLLDPKVKGYGVGGRLVCAAMIYHDGQEADRDSDYIAHVVDGNRAPIGALTENGFRYSKVVHVPKGAAGGALDHLAEPGNDYIIGHRYEFDPAAINFLILSFDEFISHRLRLRNRSSRKQIRVTLDPGLINVEAIRAHAIYVRERQLAS